MRFLSALILLIFSLGACSCAATMPNSVSYLENRAQIQGMRDATAGLVDENGTFCAGAFISQNEVLTAAHCVQTPGDIHISVDEDGNLFFEILPASVMETVDVSTRIEANSHVSHSFDVVYVDDHRDLALLRAGETYESPHAILNLPTEITQANLFLGESVYVVGHPAGFSWNVSHGFISRDLLNDDGVDMVISSCDVFFGNSGGPMIDSHGTLIGIAHALPGNQAGVATFLGMFIAPNEILHFLDDARLMTSDALNRQ